MPIDGNQLQQLASQGYTPTQVAQITLDSTPLITNASDVLPDFQTITGSHSGGDTIQMGVGLTSRDGSNWTLGDYAQGTNAVQLTPGTGTVQSMNGVMINTQNMDVYNQAQGAIGSVMNGFNANAIIAADKAQRDAKLAGKSKAEQDAIGQATEAAVKSGQPIPAVAVAAQQQAAEASQTQTAQTQTNTTGPQTQPVVRSQEWQQPETTDTVVQQLVAEVQSLRQQVAELSGGQAPASSGHQVVGKATSEDRVLNYLQAQGMVPGGDSDIAIPQGDAQQSAVDPESPEAQTAGYSSYLPFNYQEYQGYVAKGQAIADQAREDMPEVFEEVEGTATEKSEESDKSDKSEKSDKKDDKDD